MKTLLIGLGFFIVLGGGIPLAAQEPEPAPPAAVQEITDQLEPDSTHFYALPDLPAGAELTILATTTAGALDPFIGVADASIDLPATATLLREDINEALAAGADPVEIVPQVADQLFLAWDDDSGPATSALLTFTVPTAGDYQLAVTGTPLVKLAGEYRLLIGLNAPEVAEGIAQPTGATLAVLTSVGGADGTAVEERTGSLTAERPSTILTLRDMAAGDTLYLFVEATSGDLAPQVVLQDFRTKPLKSSNFTGQTQRTTLEYTFAEDRQGVRVQLAACCDDALTSGDYRLLVGVNAPEVLEGSATPTTQSVITNPIPVRIGVRMDQITSIDQVSENFGVVADVRLEWDDPALAFNPDECQCVIQTFRSSSFPQFLDQQGVTVWPVAVLYNQQGRRDSQAQTFVVDATGHVIYVERFTATLQAPDFDFRRFPFDEQQFYIRVRSEFPERFYVFEELEGYSDLGEQLGEEEWIVTDFETTIDTIDDSSRFNFGFRAERHLSYYIFRIFLPLLIITAVSWIIFFLRDYGRRVEVASGNLLLLIAFNFTISSDLPRLGYLTLLDKLLITAFVITSLAIIVNVVLRRLELTGKQETVKSVDTYVLWGYPIVFVLAIGLIFLTA